MVTMEPLMARCTGSYGLRPSQAGVAVRGRASRCRERITTKEGWISDADVKRQLDEIQRKRDGLEAERRRLGVWLEWEAADEQTQATRDSDDGDLPHPSCLRNRHTLTETSTTVNTSRATRFGHRTSIPLPLSSAPRVMRPKW